jgi:multiple sugar transport system ATP-binding protein
MQHELGITTIYVTHDQIEAMTLAHRVAILEKGVLQQLDTPANIYNHPANLFVAGFIGSPPMNVLEGSLTDGRFTCNAGSFGTHSRASGKAVVAGIRPEDGRLAASGQGQLDGEIYASELIGDHTLVTCRCGDATVTVKADKDFAGAIGQKVGIAFEERAVHLFDTTSGERIS